MRRSLTKACMSSSPYKMLHDRYKWAKQKAADVRRDLADQASIELADAEVRRLNSRLQERAKVMLLGGRNVDEVREGREWCFTCQNWR